MPSLVGTLPAAVADLFRAVFRIVPSHRATLTELLNHAWCTQFTVSAGGTPKRRLSARSSVMHVIGAPVEAATTVPASAVSTGTHTPASSRPSSADANPSRGAVSLTLAAARRFGPTGMPVVSASSAGGRPQSPRVLRLPKMGNDEPPVTASGTLLPKFKYFLRGLRKDCMPCFCSCGRGVCCQRAHSDRV